MSHWNRPVCSIAVFIKTNVISMDFLWRGKRKKNTWQLQKGTLVNPQVAFHTSEE